MLTAGIGTGIAFAAEDDGNTTNQTAQNATTVEQQAAMSVNQAADVAVLADGVQDEQSAGIAVNLHDYDDNTVNRDHALEFNDGSQLDGRAAYNTWVAEHGPGGNWVNGDRAYPNIVGNKLTDGYPTLADGVTGSDESLDYLFSPDSVGEDYINTTGLLTQDAEGYWSFDSSQQYARLNGNKFTLSDTHRTGVDGSPYFTPFDESWKNSDYDYHFGMDISASFYMPENGQVNGKDMVFSFNGDDDVWVYIDDVLVLDLGGIHDAIGGSINFRTGEITYSQTTVGADSRPRSLVEAFATAGKTWNGEDYQNHTIKFFYLERGKGSSNCQIRFNLPTIPEDEIEIEKDVDYANVNNVSDIDFNFEAYVDYDGKDGNFAKYEGSYDVYEGGRKVASGETKNGVISLKAGQTARLTGASDGSRITPLSRYYVTEVGATSDKYNVTINGTTVSTGDEESDGVTSDKYTAKDTSHVTFKNSITAENAFNLQVVKTGEVDANDTFYAKVMVGSKPYSGQYALYGADDTSQGNQTTNNGLIALKGGQNAMITGLVGGNTVTVSEVNADGTAFNDAKYLAPKYAMDDGDGSALVDGSVKTDANGVSGTANEGKALGENPEITATITNELKNKPLGTPDHTKRIGDNGDGTYTLALDVTGKTQTSGGTTTTPVDVVMIIDRSSSMNEDITTSSETKYMPVKSSNVKGSSADYHDSYLFDYWTQGDPGGPYYVFVDGEYKRLTEITKDEQHTNYWYQQQIFKVHDSWVVDGKKYDPTITTFYTQHNSSSTMSRIAAVKQAANAFVDSAAASAGASHIRIGVVSFAGTDSSEDTSSIDRQLTAVVGGDGTSNAETIKRTINAINAPKSGAGTYPDDGFKDANIMLSSSPEGTRKVVIFFTDGGPGGGSMWGQSWDIENGAANDAVEAALPLKKNGATIYSVGVLDNADPKTDISNVTGNSEDTDKINAFMHAVSSNYPKATGFAHNQIGTRTPNSDYYKVAEDAEQLNEIFQDIFHDSTKTQAYDNVSIVDELSQWAQVVHPDNFKENATLTVEKPSAYDEQGNVTQWDAVGENDPGYPTGYEISYTPATDDETTTGTVRVDFPDDYELQDGWRYTLKFGVKPTDDAYQAFADNGYKLDDKGNSSAEGNAFTGDEGTDLYSPGTSEDQEGFRSNKSAYVEYSEDGESQDPAYYDHPVLQVSVAPVVIGSQFGLQEKKTVIGDSATKDEFHFTVTAKPTGSGDSATTAVDAAVLAGWTACTGGVTDGCYAESGSDVVYSFTNPDRITDGDSDVVRTAGEDKAVTFTPDMVGRTFTYVYAESGELPNNWYNQSDVKVWTVTATVDYADDTKSALKVTVNVYHGDDASGNPADTYVYTDENLKPVHESGSSNEAVPTVSFTNTYVAPVSALPLTGGDSTARTLLLAGGGVLLVAGAAWLLARRRRV